MRRLTVLASSAAAAIVSVTVAGWGTVAGATAADDQAAADAAIAAFIDRVTAAGWVSQGPADPSEATDEELFTECEQEFAVIEAMFTGEFAGETAQAYSDQFVFSPEGTQPATTEAFDFSIEDEEFLVAFVVSVDEGHVDELDAMVQLIGSPELAECAELSMADQLGEVADADPLGTLLSTEMITYSIENEADLGVAESSASLSIAFEADIFGEPLAFDTTMTFARVDRTLVGLFTGHTGLTEPTSGIDRRAELAALADDVGA